jgi:biotin-dependent carboxylase-like uncharacterized protein
MTDRSIDCLLDRVIEILDPGPLGTVQDLGRPGHGALGVGESGAADRGSLRLANRLVGNPEGVAALELTFGGLRARFVRSAIVAVTGAPCPIVAGPRAVAMNGPIDVRAGEELVLGPPTEGLRSYVAVRGGVDVPPVLGSRSTDLLSGIGPPALRPGVRLPIGDAATSWPNVDLAPSHALTGLPTVRILPGPRTDWFEPSALAVLCSAPYQVTADSNRVGVRLDGSALARSVTGELPPEGMVRGALQVPPDGRPILFLADHPVTGGYPVIAVVSDADLDRTAQLRPGDFLRFRLGSR